MGRSAAIFLIVAMPLSMPFPVIAAVDHDSSLAAFFSTPAYIVLYLYRNVAGHARPSACPMRPSCSTYSLEAFHRRGPFWGYLMTADRLHRCGHDKLGYTVVWTDNGSRLLDPVDE